MVEAPMAGGWIVKATAWVLFFDGVRRAAQATIPGVRWGGDGELGCGIRWAVCRDWKLWWLDLQLESWLLEVGI